MPNDSFSVNRRQWLGGAAVTAAACRGLLASTPPALAADVFSADSHVEIWDSHVHLAGFAGDTAEAKVDRLLEFADRMAIARAVIFMGWPWSYSPTPEQMRFQNDQVLAALRHAPDRLLGYVYLNPSHREASLEEFRRCVVDGPMIGVKLWVATRCDDQDVDAIVTAATEHQAAVYQHTWVKTTGNLAGESTPEELVRLAKRHPEAKLICGHSGGNWELGLRSAREVASLLFEIAGADPTAGITKRSVQLLGADRVLYGSDAGGRSLATQLGKIIGADISDADKALILGGNLRRLLAPILRIKGIAVG